MAGSKEEGRGLLLQMTCESEVNPWMTRTRCRHRLEPHANHLTDEHSRPTSWSVHDTACAVEKTRSQHHRRRHIRRHRHRHPTTITAFTCQSVDRRATFASGTMLPCGRRLTFFFPFCVRHVLIAHALENSALRLFFFVPLRFDSWRWRSYACRSRTGPSLFRWIVLHLSSSFCFLCILPRIHLCPMAHGSRLRVFSSRVSCCRRSDLGYVMRPEGPWQQR